MFIPYCFKNKLYKLSCRNYLCDYSKIESQKIDMTMSGKYLSSYPNLKINVSEFDKYPLESNIKELENLIKEKILTKSEIIIGSGSNGLLQNIIKILFRKKGNLVTPFYSFDQAEYAVTSFGGITKRVYTSNYELNLDNVIKSLDRKTKMIYICNPNNLTGKFIELKKLIELSKKVRIPIVIDESGIEFTRKKGILESVENLPKNMLILRSFSKAYGLANLRIGYLACSTEFKQKYLENITTNECSGISCTLAKEVIKYSDNMKKNVNKILDEREYMISKLEQLGILCLNSQSNVIFTKTYFSDNFILELNKNNVSVVPIYDKSNNLHVRLAIQSREENEKFLEILHKLLDDKKITIDIYDD